MELKINSMKIFVHTTEGNEEEQRDYMKWKFITFFFQQPLICRQFFASKNVMVNDLRSQSS
jgi:hypothetical protein